MTSPSRILSATITAMVVLLARSVSGQQSAPTITKVRTIGCESCGGVLQFGSIWDVSITAAGELLVTDRDAPMLRRFDATGAPAWNGGRKGKGPGEYTMPVRASITASGIVVVDMMNRRVTALGPTGVVASSIPLIDMPTAASVNGRGDVILGADDFRGTLRLQRVDLNAPAPEVKALRNVTGSAMNNSVAVATDGSVAIVLNLDKYEIQRFDAAGNTLASIVRDIPRVKRTPEEEAEFRKRVSRDRGMVAAEAKSQGKAGSVSAPVFAPEELSTKGHLRIDGLRFDGAGRLWALTQRGDLHKTVFDVFSASGAFLGSVSVPGQAMTFALGGAWLAIGGENEDGIPVVTVWSVK